MKSSTFDPGLSDDSFVRVWALPKDSSNKMVILIPAYIFIIM